MHLNPMPYADKEKHRERVRSNYRIAYLTDPAFAEKERERQRKHYEANREKIIARVMARRKAKKAQEAQQQQ